MAELVAIPDGAEGEPGPILLTSEQIAERVKTLGAEIEKDYQGQTIQMVVVLDGGWIFASDLARSIRSEVVINFIKASSYGDLTTSSGRVRIKGGIQFDMKGEDVIVVDDIVDTGRTAEALLTRLDRYDARSVRFASLLSKTARRLVPVEIDYLGFEVPNKFVVGYGMDFKRTYRHLPNIHALPDDYE